ncbi:4'-phosphopantetheinyl transferase family protein [Plantactinospora sp. CA-290183]|uniref:4'-phosphopantetheinyl transferase family protein n=1 Tax=Plantactinospora sp. CA-290183 TaxID=3240006 RepID=UPI003D8BD5DC
MDRITCHVFVADTVLAQNRHSALLNAEERERRAGFRQDQDRVRFTTAVALLRLAVGARTATPPAAVRIDRRCRRCSGPHGKPQLPGTDLHASVSHSGARVAVALTSVAPVGVDLEEIKPKDIAGLSTLCLAPGEPLERDEDFFTYWCRKESVVKATGDGIAVPLARVLVGRAGEPPALRGYPSGDVPAAMADLPVGPGYAGAVTVLAAGRLDVVMADAAALLEGGGVAVSAAGRG